jgi:hypothetical protein
MHNPSFRKYFFISLSFFTLILTSCGDKAGDAIATMNKSEFPEQYDVLKSEVYTINGLKGPDYLADFTSRIPTPWQRYTTGSTSRIAILLTDTNSAWLGLVHGLKTIGVPFLITNDYQRAIQHKVVIAYPIISGAALSPEALQALAAYPRSGGTLIGFSVLGALNEVFGFKEALPSKQHFEVHFKADSIGPTAEFKDPAESTISIGNKRLFKETIGTYSYSDPELKPLATYEDRSAAIVEKPYQGGTAIAIGFDMGFILLKAHNNRHDEFNRTKANGFEPTIDVMMRLIKNIYLQYDRQSVIIQTVPYDKSLSIIITHNIDFKGSMAASIKLAQTERSMGLHSTYFTQTRYIKDYRPRLINSTNDLKELNKLVATGHEVASNTVSGSPLFDQFEQGTGKEQYPNYRPYVMAPEKTYKGTIFGEMRISKYLIDQFVTNQTVGSFRSNYCYTPYSLPQSMIACGYRFSSSIPANSTLSHFPLQLNYNKEYDMETEVFELPITDDDNIPPYHGQRLQSAIALAKKIATYGGCYIAQVHANPLSTAALPKFYKAMKDQAWFGTLRDFGEWWIARNEVTLDVDGPVGNRTVLLNVPKRMEGLALRLPWRSSVKAVEPEGIKYFQDGRQIIFELAEGTIKIHLNN